MVEMLGQLLGQLVSSDNAVRKQAEEQLDKHWLVQQPGVLLVGLATLINHHPDAYVFFIN